MKKLLEITNVVGASVDALELEYEDIRTWLVAEVNLIQSADFSKIDDLKKDFELKYGTLKNETHKKALETIDRVIILNLGYADLISKIIIDWEVFPAGVGAEKNNIESQEIEKGPDFFARKEWTLAVAKKIDEKAKVHRSLERKDATEPYWVVEFPTFGVAMFVANKNGRATYFTPLKGWKKFSKQTKLAELRGHDLVEYLKMNVKIKNEHDWKEVVKEKILAVQRATEKDERKEVGIELLENKDVSREVELKKYTKFPIEYFFGKNIYKILVAVKTAYGLKKSEKIDLIDFPKSKIEINITYQNNTYPKQKLINLQSRIGRQLKKKYLSLSELDPQTLGRNYLIFRDEGKEELEVITLLENLNFPIEEFFEENIDKVLAALKMAYGLGESEKIELIVAPKFKIKKNISYQNRVYFKQKLHNLQQKIGDKLKKTHLKLVVLANETLGKYYLIYRDNGSDHREAIKKLTTKAEELSNKMNFPIEDFFNENSSTLLDAIKIMYGLSNSDSIELIRSPEDQKEKNIIYKNETYPKQKLCNLQKKIGTKLKKKYPVLDGLYETTIGKYYLIYKEKKKNEEEIIELLLNLNFSIECFFSKDVIKPISAIKLAYGLSACDPIELITISESKTEKNIAYLNEIHHKQKLHNLQQRIGIALQRKYPKTTKLHKSTIGKYYLILRDEGFDHKEAVKKLE